MKVPDERSGAHELRVGQVVRRRGGHDPFDVGQDLPPLLVEPQRPRCAAEADRLQVPQQVVHEPRARMRRPTYGAPQPDDSRRLCTAAQANLRIIHGAIVSTPGTKLLYQLHVARI